MIRFLTFKHLLLVNIMIFGFTSLGCGVTKVVVDFIGDPAPKEVYRDLAWSPDGQFIAVGGDTGLFIFDSMTLESVRIFETYTTGISWSRNDFLAANTSTSILIFSGNQFSNQITYSAKALPYWEQSVTFSATKWSPTQDVLAAGLSNGTIQLFSIELDDTGHFAIQPSMVLMDHKDEIKSLDWNSDGTLLFTVSRDNTIKVWDIVTGQIIYSIEDLDNSLRNGDIVLSYDNNFFAHNHLEDVYIREISTGTVVSRISMDSNINAIALNPIDYCLVTVDQGKVNIWDTRNSRHLLSLNHNSYVEEVAWSPNGQKIASVSSNHDERFLIIWDVNTGNVVLTHEEDY